jgi:hypothetical protein
MDVGMKGTHTQLMVKIIDFEDAVATDDAGYCWLSKKDMETRHHHIWVDAEILKGGEVDGKSADGKIFCGNLW